MPYGRRYDWPGALHHVMSRGVNGMPIFMNTYHKWNFIQVLDEYLPGAGLQVHAWAVMDNHFHLLTETGQVPLSLVMHRVLTKWATRYNEIEKRQGRVFQGRYRSLLIDDEKYFFTVAAYINTNPLRAGCVPGEEELEEYPFCGHSFRSSGRLWERAIPEAELIRYRNALEKVSRNGFDPLENITSAGLKGVSSCRRKSMNERKAFFYGDTTYAADILRNGGERRLTPVRARYNQHRNAVSTLKEVCREHKVTEEVLRGPSRMKRVCLAREELICRLVLSCGFSFSDAGRFLGRSRQAISNAFHSAARRIMSNYPQEEKLQILIDKLAGGLKVSAGV